jgi:FlaG/FlaF family flagellin (archaellin)
MGLKANRKFIEDKRGMSAVIALILIVAITVALVAVAYAWVSGLIPTGTTVAKRMESVWDSTNTTSNNVIFSVASAETGIFWADLNVTATKTTGVVTYVTGNVSHSPSGETEVETGQTFAIDCPDSYSGVYTFKVKYEDNLIWISNEISLT